MDKSHAYLASKTLKQFHLSEKFVRCAMGPIGSGKSVACCIEIMKKAVAQTPDAKGIRYSRWLIIRNTYRELIDTTIKTWFDWFPESLGVYRKNDMKWTLSLPLGDGTKIHLEVLFRALSTPEDVKKLLSLELTGCWINEAREVPKQVLEMAMGRVGRYPSARLGIECWYGIIMDTNPPDTDHWIPALFDDNKNLDELVMFKQPSGLSSEAENIKNLPAGYYNKLMIGKDKNWVDVYVNGQYGFISDGMPVYPEFSYGMHVSEEPLLFDPRLDLWIGCDWGRTPAAAFAQLQNDRWVFIDEIVTENTGARAFAKRLKKKLKKDYRFISYDNDKNIIEHNSQLFVFGDPSGGDMTQVDDETPFRVMLAEGVDVYPSPSQDPVIRREALAIQMTQLSDQRLPRLAVCNKKCPTLVKGLSGGFKYKRVAVPGEDKFRNKPDKNRFSHVCEAAEYLLVGAGEDVTAITSENVDIDYSTLNRMA